MVTKKIESLLPEDNNQRKTLLKRIEICLLKEEYYFRDRYSKEHADILINNYREMFLAALERGDLDDCPDQTDLLQCITEKQLKKAPTDNIHVKVENLQLSSDIKQQIERAEGGDPYVAVVIMNQSKTLFFDRNAQKHQAEILSYGQGGCTNIVLAPRGTNDGKVSLLHYDPMTMTGLLDELRYRIGEHTDMTDHEAIVFIKEGEHSIKMIGALEAVFRNKFPNIAIRIEHIENTSISTQQEMRSNSGVLRVIPDKDLSIRVKFNNNIIKLLAQ